MAVTEAMIPIVLFLSFAVMLSVWLLTRHKERMTMIDKGLKAEDIKAMYERGTMRVNPLSSLKWGLIFVCVGFAALLGIYLQDVFYISDGIIPSLMALFGGVGLITFYALANKRLKS